MASSHIFFHFSSSFYSKREILAMTPKWSNIILCMKRLTKNALTYPSLQMHITDQVSQSIIVIY